MSTCPPFNEAIAQFQSFCVSQGKPQKLAWIFREDVTTYKRTLWLRIPLPAENVQAAEQLYSHGLAQGFGITINQIGEVDQTSLCFLWLPSDEIDMSYAMMNGNLKLSISQSQYDVRLTPSATLFRLMKLLNAFRRMSSLEQELCSKRGRI